MSTQTHTPHKQVLVKVNAFVDEGIAPLVEALNGFSQLETYESCQGRQGIADGLAYVQMEYRNSAAVSLADVAVFVDNLAKAFAKHGNGAGVETVGVDTIFSIEWWGDKSHPFIMVRMPLRYVVEASSVLTRVRSDFENDSLGR